MLRYALVQNNDTKRLAQDCCDEAEYSESYSANHDEFLNMFTKFWLMWKGYLGCISLAKHRNELFADNNQPVHSSPYLVGPKTREFEKIAKKRCPKTT